MTDARRERAPLPVWAGAAAFVGGVLWVYKSAAILLTRDQPDYAFELAIACFGVAVLGLAGASTGERSRSHRTRSVPPPELAADAFKPTWADPTVYRPMPRGDTDHGVDPAPGGDGALEGPPARTRPR